MLKNTDNSKYQHKKFDKLSTKKLLQHVREIIPSEQHGFISKRGTISNLLQADRFISSGLEQNTQVDAVYLDYSKAFDQVEHRLCAAELANTGMPFNLFKTIMSFIVSRTYHLKINGTATGNKFIVYSSVPQKKVKMDLLEH